MQQKNDFRGTKILAVCRLMPFSGGQKQEIVLCLEGVYATYLVLTVVDIKGKKIQRKGCRNNKC